MKDILGFVLIYITLFWGIHVQARVTQLQPSVNYKNHFINTKDKNISVKDGVFTYNYLLSIPPSRGNLLSNLLLTYSSSNKTEGELGVSWNLDIHYIKKIRDIETQLHSKYVSSFYGELVQVGNYIFVPRNGPSNLVFRVKEDLTAWFLTYPNGQEDLLSAISPRGPANDYWTLVQSQDVSCKIKNSNSCNKVEFSYNIETHNLIQIKYNLLNSEYLSIIEFNYKKKEKPNLVVRNGEVILKKDLLSEIRVLQRSKVAYSYKFDFEKAVDNNYFLAQIHKYGSSQKAFPKTFFSYDLENTNHQKVRPINQSLANDLMDRSSLGLGPFLGDFNGDGLADVFYVVHNTAYVRFKESANSEAFSSPQAFFEKGKFPNWQHIQMSDINADGLLDVVNVKNTNQVLLNKGNSFELTDFFEGKRRALLQTHIVLDADKDNHSDIYDPTTGQCSYNYFQEGDVLKLQGSKISDNRYNSNFLGFRVGDFNGDGYDDLLIITEPHSRIRFGLGSCQWSQPYNVDFGDDLIGKRLANIDLNKVHVVDFNRDGLSDLVFYAFNKVIVLKSDNGLNYSTYVVQPENDTIHDFLLGDLDSNGQLEVIWCTSQKKCKSLESDTRTSKLLSGVENQFGNDWKVKYSDSLLVQNKNWKSFVPFSYPVVISSEESNANGLKKIKKFQYKDQFYNSKLSKYSGFGEVIVTTSPGYFDGKLTSAAKEEKYGFLQENHQSGVDLNSLNLLLGRQLYYSINDTHFESYKYNIEQNIDLNLPYLSQITNEKLVSGGVDIFTSVIQNYDSLNRTTGERVFQGRTVFDSSNPLRLLGSLFESGELIREVKLIYKESASSVLDKILKNNFVFSNLVEREEVYSQSNMLISSTAYSYFDLTGLVNSKEQFVGDDLPLRKTSYSYSSKFPLFLAGVFDSKSSIIKSFEPDPTGVFVAQEGNGNAEYYSYSHNEASGKIIKVVDPNKVTTIMNYDSLYNLQSSEKNKNNQRWAIVEFKTIFPSQDVQKTVTDKWLDDDGKNKQTHVEFTGASGFLYKLDEGPNSRKIISKLTKIDTQGNQVYSQRSPVFEDNKNMHWKITNYDSLGRVKEICDTFTKLCDSKLYFNINDSRIGPVLIVESTDSNGYKYLEGYNFDEKRIYHEVKASEGDLVFKVIRNGSGFINQILLPNNEYRNYQFNGLGEVIKIEDKTFGTFKINRDHRGRVFREEIVGVGGKEYFYDNSDRILKTHWYDSDFKSFQTYTSEFGSDPNQNNVGRVFKNFYPKGQDVISYNYLGKPDRIFREILGRKFYIDPRYNFFGQLKGKEITYSGKVFGDFSIQYDDSGYTQAVENITSEMIYSPSGQLTRSKLFNNKILEREYQDGSLKVNNITFESDSKKLSMNFNYDEYENIISSFDKQLDSRYLYTDDRLRRLKNYKFANRIVNRDYNLSNFNFGPQNAPSDNVQFGFLLKGGIQDNARNLQYLYGARIHSGDINGRKFIVGYDPSAQSLFEYNDKKLTIYLDDNFIFENGQIVTKISLSGLEVLSKGKDASVIVFDDNNLPRWNISKSGELQIEKWGSYGEAFDDLGKANFLVNGSIGLAGQYFSNLTKLYSMGSRHYSPESKKFTSPDSFVLQNPEIALHDPYQLDLYQYSKDNPLSYTDIQGNFAVSNFVFIGAIATYMASAGAGFGLGSSSDKTREGKIDDMLKGAVVGGAIGIAAGSAVVAAPIVLSAAPTVLESAMAMSATGYGTASTFATNTTLQGLSYIGASSTAGASAMNYVLSDPKRIDNLLNFASGTVQSVFNFSSPYSGNPYELLPGIAIENYKNIESANYENK